MADKTLNVRVKHRYDTEANWTSKNPVLLAGELAYTSDGNNKGRYKIGDGSTQWKNLPYATLSWGEITSKPSSFTPSSHTHDDRYYTESEMNTKLAGKSDTSHTHSQYYDSNVSRTKNTVLAAPNGSDGKATFRALTTADIPTLTKSKISDFPASMPASDVSSWAKASTKPSYTKSEVGLGNVDNTADVNKSVKYATSAGSAGSCTGNAATATKLATARTVSGGTDITMSFNYDGSGNSSANIGYYTCNVSQGNTNNYPYHRFAKLDTITGSYSDKTMTVYITQDYNNGGFGIARISLRTNNSSNVASAEAKWLIRSGLSADALQVAIYEVYGKTYADAFLKLSGTYCSTVIRAVASGSRGNVVRTWTLINSKEVDNTSATDPKTSIESYIDIPTAGTKIHNQEYSRTVIASDSGVTSSANSVSWGGISGKPAIVGKSIKSLTAQGTSGWTSLSDAQNLIPDMSVFAYWNGAYSGKASNLAYCNKGAFGSIVTKDTGDYATASHTHNYAGSSSVGGSATSAVKLDTTTAGSATQPVYFSGGKPVACTYTLGKSVPSDAVFTDTKYTHPTTSGNKHIPSGGSAGQILRWSADGTAVWGSDNNTTYTVGTTNYSGTTKLYTETGTATDGTMTQNAITTALNGKANSSHTHNYLPLSGGTITGSLKTQNGHYVHSASGTAGTEGWINIATIKIAKTYANSAIEITYTSRGYSCPISISILFENSNTLDPAIKYFIYKGDTEVNNTNAPRLYKTSTSTWNLYIKKSEASDVIDIVDFVNPYYLNDKVTITWTNTQVSSYPSDAASPVSYYYDTKYGYTAGYGVGIASHAGHASTADTADVANSVEWKNIKNNTHKHDGVFNANNTVTLRLTSDGKFFSPFKATSVGTEIGVTTFANREKSVSLGSVNNMLNGLALAGSIYSLGTYNSTTTTNRPMTVGSDGRFWRYQASSSTLRFKNHIYKIDYNDAKSLLNTNVYSFRYNDNGQPKNGEEHAAIDRYGFILEDMEKTFPMAVEYDEKGLPNSWCVQIVVPTMLAIVKEHENKISKLEEENSKLKEKISEIDILKAEINELKSLIQNK